MRRWLTPVAAKAAAAAAHGRCRRGGPHRHAIVTVWPGVQLGIRWVAGLVAVLLGVLVGKDAQPDAVAGRVGRHKPPAQRLGKAGKLQRDRRARGGGGHNQGTKQLRVQESTAPSLPAVACSGPNWRQGGASRQSRRLLAAVACTWCSGACGSPRRRLATQGIMNADEFFEPWAVQPGTYFDSAQTQLHAHLDHRRTEPLLGLSVQRHARRQHQQPGLPR